MKLSDEFRKVAAAPAEGKFYLLLTLKAERFAFQYFGGREPGFALSDEEKTLAYLFLAAIAESEGL